MPWCTFTDPEVARVVHAYPTFAEGPARAADDYLRSRFLTDRVRRFTRPVLALLRLLDRPAAGKVR